MTADLKLAIALLGGALALFAAALILNNFRAAAHRQVALTDDYQTCLAYVESRTLPKAHWAARDFCFRKVRGVWQPYLDYLRDNYISHEPIGPFNNYLAAADGGRHIGW